ncbi:unnamed protein product, partial [Discosporangium mesarthrocarpum]
WLVLLEERLALQMKQPMSRKICSVPALVQGNKRVHLVNLWLIDAINSCRLIEPVQDLTVNGLPRACGLAPRGLGWMEKVQRCQGKWHWDAMDL